MFNKIQKFKEKKMRKYKILTNFKVYKFIYFLKYFFLLNQTLF